MGAPLAKYAQQCPQTWKGAGAFDLDVGRDTIRVELRNIVQQPIQHLDQLASRFYSENLSDTEESSGLGLYIIQNFVEILGGDLQLATEADWFVLTITHKKKGLSIAQAFLL